jgi:hypothetical protein
MKPKQEPTPTAETPWEPLSPEQITSGIEWLERTKADLRPASRYPAIQQQRAAMNQHPIGSFARLEAARARRRKPADPAIVCVRQDIVTPQRRGPVAGDPVPAMTDCRREADMDSRRRYNSSAAAICGLLGMIILPIVAHRARFRDDRLFSILVVVGLYGGWALGAAYIYPLFYYKNGTPRPHTARIQVTVQKWRQRMCATGLHSWEKWMITKTCRICGKRQVI